MARVALRRQHRQDLLFKELALFGANGLGASYLRGIRAAATVLVDTLAQDHQQDVQNDHASRMPYSTESIHVLSGAVFRVH